MRLKVTPKMFRCDAAKIRRAASEVDRQAGFYARNGAKDVMRFMLIDLRARALEQAAGRARQRYALYEIYGWD